MAEMAAHDPETGDHDRPKWLISLQRNGCSRSSEIRSLDELPEFGVGVGLRTIIEQSRRVVLVVTGSHKRGAVFRLRSCADFTPDWPASFIYRCHSPLILLDRFANPVAGSAT